MAYNLERLRRINICMTDELYSECRAYAARKGINFSELVRRALDGDKYKRVTSSDDSSGNRRVIISMAEPNYAAYRAHAERMCIPFSGLVRHALRIEMRRQEEG